MSLAALQNDLSLFVAREHAAQWEALHRLWNKPQPERVEEGYCIEDLRVATQLSTNLWRLECAGNDSRFREGDFVRISRGDPNFPILEGIIEHAGDTSVELRKWKDLSNGGLQLGDQGLCIDESFVDLQDRYIAALAELGKSPIGREVILPLIDGSLSPTVDAEISEKAHIEANNAGMNERQAEAVANAVATDSCWLIHGPPGTGKTSVLAWIVADLLAKGERILVTSLTHRAINNLLAAIVQRSPECRRVAKVSPFREASLPCEWGEKFSDLRFARDGGAYVIGATPFALRSKRLKDCDFDTVLIDEASQVTIPLAVMAMLGGKRFILSGDHKQLPPVVVSLAGEEARKMSIFGSLVGRGFDTFLNITHRLNNPLCEWPSETFYLSKLHSHPRAAARRLRIEARDSRWAEIMNPELCLVWVAVAHRGSRVYSAEEVVAAEQILTALHESGVEWKEIGVITPFRRQARYLRYRLAGKQADKKVPPGLTIDTVDRMQGQEREVMLVSFTTSDEEFLMRMQEFVFQPERLNVSVTRARSKLILVASPELLAFAERDESHPGMRAFVSLLGRAQRVEIPE